MAAEKLAQCGNVSSKVISKLTVNSCDCSMFGCYLHCVMVVDVGLILSPKGDQH